MVLELLINPKKVGNNMWEFFFLGTLYALIAAGLSVWLFNAYASLVMVAFTVIAAMPLVHYQISKEEKYALVHPDERSILQEHSKAIAMYLLLFLGFLAGFLVLYMVLPHEITVTTFDVQLKTASVEFPTGNFVAAGEALSYILLNNTKILFLVAIFSFLYGAGALFILTWNASVMAVVIGQLIKDNLLVTGNIFTAATFGLLRYTLHGVPEIAAFMIAGLASGILSFAIARHDWKSPQFKTVLCDVGLLFIVAFALLALAALIEVFVTPVLPFY